jgi:hypothetical protein
MTQFSSRDFEISARKKFEFRFKIFRIAIENTSCAIFGAGGRSLGARVLLMIGRKI